MTMTGFRASVTAGHPVTLSGSVIGAPPGGGVVLYERPYPYRVIADCGRTLTAANGSFSFIVFPDRDARYGAFLVGTAARAVVRVAVTGRTITKLKALSLGRAKVTLVVFHPRDLRWGHARVRWSFASGLHRRFVAAPSTRTVRLSPYVIVLSTTIALPAGRFRWRGLLSCSRRPRVGGSAPPAGLRRARLSRRGLSPGGLSRARRRRRAEAYLAGGPDARRSLWSTARAACRASMSTRTFITASVVKAMLLVAYLRRLTRSVSAGRLRQQLVPVPDDPRLGQLSRDPVLVDRRRRRALFGRAAPPECPTSRSPASGAPRELSPADQAVLLRDGLADSVRVRRLRALPALDDRRLESWGIPAIATPAWLQGVLQGGLAEHRARAAGASDRATGGASPHRSPSRS